MTTLDIMNGLLGTPGPPAVVPERLGVFLKSHEGMTILDLALRYATSPKLARVNTDVTVEFLRFILEHYPSLRELVLSNSQNLANLEPLSGVISLQKLNISGCIALCSTSPLRPLQELANLTDLNFSMGHSSTMKTIEPCTAMYRHPFQTEKFM